jgi:hypothetical protein
MHHKLYVGQEAAPQQPEIRFGSWLCENDLAEALRTRDLGEMAVLGDFDEFGDFSVWKCT